ncbi:MAG: hypothetical protein KDC27_08525 [Acidobacteria bacterium]|nr:hypothetical protein [Acidobacteriota bacterium]
MATVVAPGVAFASLGLCWLVDLKLGEKPIGRITAAAYLSASAMLAILFVNMLQAGESAVSVSLGAWFQIDEYSFPLTLLGDRLSIPMMMLTAILIGLIGSFSRRYLHRESGYRRFFSLLNLFGFGSLLIFAAGSFDLLIGGWELVGITSVLLIAFFQERREPVRNAVRVFAIYRAGDIGLLVGVFLLHHFSASASFEHLFIGQWPIQHAGPLTAAQALTVCLLFLVAAAPKAAQFPFSGWLPRAMEGPTPSSAIFYGAISVHAGAYLLLRAAPILEAAPLASAAVVLVGAVTAVVGTLAGRACADAKTALAHGALAQLGLIFMEIGFGLRWLALLHILGHAAVRTLEFLRAPSTLYDYHRVRAAAGGELAPAGLYFEAAIPDGLRNWLYRCALDRAHVDTILDRFLIRPLHALAAALAAIERRLLSDWETGDPRRPVPFAQVAEKFGGHRG